jgi:hypothetical protein
LANRIFLVEVLASCKAQNHCNMHLTEHYAKEKQLLKEFRCPNISGSLKNFSEKIFRQTMQNFAKSNLSYVL